MCSAAKTIGVFLPCSQLSCFALGLAEWSGRSLSPSVTVMAPPTSGSVFVLQAAERKIGVK